MKACRGLRRPGHVSLYDWFRPKVRVRPCGCWSLPGVSSNSAGRPHARKGDRLFYLARVFYEEEVGPIPDGLMLAHNCLHKWCVNPRHCRPATRSDNFRDEYRAGVGAKSKFTPKDIRAIRRAHKDGERVTAIARRLGVQHPCISRIINGERWSYV